MSAGRYITLYNSNRNADLEARAADGDSVLIPPNQSVKVMKKFTWALSPGLQVVEGDTIIAKSAG